MKKTSHLFNYISQNAGKLKHSLSVMIITVNKTPSFTSPKTNKSNSSYIIIEIAMKLNSSCCATPMLRLINTTYNIISSYITNYMIIANHKQIG